MIRTRNWPIGLLALGLVIGVAGAVRAQSASVFLPQNASKFFESIKLDGNNNGNGAIIDISNGMDIVPTANFFYRPLGGITSNQIAPTGGTESGNAAVRDAWAEGANQLNGYYNGQAGLTSTFVAGYPGAVLGIGYVDNNFTQYGGIN